MASNPSAVFRRGCSEANFTPPATGSTLRQGATSGSAYSAEETVVHFVGYH